MIATQCLQSRRSILELMTTSCYIIISCWRNWSKPLRILSMKSIIAFLHLVSSEFLLGISWWKSRNSWESRISLGYLETVEMSKKSFGYLETACLSISQKSIGYFEIFGVSQWSFGYLKSFGVSWNFWGISKVIWVSRNFWGISKRLGTLKLWPIVVYYHACFHGE